MIDAENDLLESKIYALKDALRMTIARLYTSGQADEITIAYALAETLISSVSDREFVIEVFNEVLLVDAIPDDPVPAITTIEINTTVQ